MKWGKDVAGVGAPGLRFHDLHRTGHTLAAPGCWQAWDTLRAGAFAAGSVSPLGVAVTGCSQRTFRHSQ